MFQLRRVRLVRVSFSIIGSPWHWAVLLQHQQEPSEQRRGSNLAGVEPDFQFGCYSRQRSELGRKVILAAVATALIGAPMGQAVRADDTTVIKRDNVGDQEEGRS